MKAILLKLLELYLPSIKGVTLETLDLKLPRTLKHIFYDDGFVDSVDDRTAWLAYKYEDPGQHEKEDKECTSIREGITKSLLQ